MIDFQRIHKLQKDREYAKAHRAMSVLFGRPSVCAVCGTIDDRRYEWAQIHGAPMVATLENFVRMCVPCHRIYDKTEEGNAKISATLKSKGIKPPSRKGATMPPESVEKMRVALTGRTKEYVPRKFTNEQVTDIKQRTREGYGGNVAQLAEEFGVSTVTIRKIGRKVI